MVRKLLGVVVVLIAALLVAGTPALAQGRGHAKRQRDRIEVRKKRSQRNPRVVIRTSPSVFFGDFSRSGRPPGWDRGRKAGWGNCNVPPGLAKKQGCRGFSFRDRDRRDRRGRIIRRGGVPRRGGVIVIPIPR